MYEHRLNDDCKGKLEGKNFDLLNVDGKYVDRLCGVPGSILRHYKEKVVGLERGALSLVSTTEELLDRKVASPV
jgi:hypothetical protein